MRRARAFGWAPLALALLIGIALGTGAPSVSAQDLDVPILERSSGDLDTCALGEVANLKPGGDGFLAVRAGPGTDHRKLDQLKNGDRVWLFDQRGDWVGVIYDVELVACGPIDKTRMPPHPGRRGWIHMNWVNILAG
ncbi:SH3 domain-containing protein [Amorphus coralli]|uniref:SH3 domain-containing protein n=1 Tax=Amorphus coralli TaxID=340680 RepID=UPI000368F7E5|nr:SH3 domain-containing protein [Amorphus coralli]